MLSIVSRQRSHPSGRGSCNAASSVLASIVIRRQDRLNLLGDPLEPRGTIGCQLTPVRGQCFRCDLGIEVSILIDPDTGSKLVGSCVRSLSNVGQVALPASCSAWVEGSYSTSDAKVAQRELIKACRDSDSDSYSNPDSTPTHPIDRDWRPLRKVFDTVSGLFRRAFASSTAWVPASRPKSSISGVSGTWLSTLIAPFTCFGPAGG